MAQHSVDDVYAQVTEIKKKLEAASKEKPEEKPKEEPSQIENWAKSIGFGLDEVVKTIKDFKISSIAAWSTLGSVVAGIVISNFIDKELLATKALNVVGLERRTRQSTSAAHEPTSRHFRVPHHQHRHRPSESDAQYLHRPLPFAERSHQGRTRRVA